MINWNDLKLILGIARARQLGGAAVALAIDHSTAFRRLNAIERQLGVRLFDRLPGGMYSATAEGQRFSAAAELVETEMMTLEREVLGRDARPSGILRVTAPEPLAFSVLPDLLAQFRSEYPGIVVELIAEDRTLSLSRREADIALRDSPREPTLHGRKLSQVRWALYASEAWAHQRGPLRRLDALGDWPIIGWGAGAQISAATWLEEHVQEASVVHRTSSIVEQLAAVRAGIGVALLPCYLADQQSDLVRVLRTPIEGLTREMWIVAHSDLRKTARVRAFFDVVGVGLAKLQRLFSGQESRAQTS